MHLTQDQFELWAKHRKYTFIVFYALTAIIGTEYAIVMPTLLNYLKNTIKCDHSEIWFGAIVSSYWFTSFLGSVTITVYADRTRNVRQCLLVVIAIVALGNLLYTIPFSPVFPLVGRIMQGFGDSLISIFTGEIARVYQQDEVLSRLSILISSYYLTFILSPAANVIFAKVNFKFLSIPYTVSNFPNLLIGFGWLCCFIVTMFFVKNLSKKYDLKSDLCRNSVGNNNGDNNDKSNELVVIQQNRLVLEKTKYYGSTDAVLKEAHVSVIDFDNYNNLLQGDRRPAGTKLHQYSDLSHQYTKRKNKIKDLNGITLAPDNNKEIQEFPMTVHDESYEAIKRKKKVKFNTKNISHKPVVQDLAETLPTKVASTIMDNNKESFDNDIIPQKSLSLRRLLSSSEFRFILVLNFICAYISVAFFDIGLPLVGSEFYGFSPEILATFFSITGFAFLITLILISKKACLRNEVHLILNGLSLFMVCLQFMALSIIFRQSRRVGIGCLVGFTLSLGIGWSVEQVLLASLLSQLIPSSTQTYAEGVRRAVSSTAYVLAGILTPMMHQYLIQQSFIFTILIFISIFYLWSNRYKYSNIQILK